MRKLFVVAAIVGGAQIANAQPTPTEPAPGGEPTEPTPPPAPPPAPAPAPAPAPMVIHEAPPPADAWRPTELSFGIGLGYTLPAALDQPNTASVRLRLPSGLTIEPRVVAGNTKNTTDNGTTSTTDAVTEVNLGALIRKPFISRGRTDFEGIGAFSLDTQTTDPDGDNNNTTTTVFALSWGIGVGFWITPHWQLSATATNPLLSYGQTSHQVAPDMTTKTSQTTIAIEFAPTIAFMIHLYN